MFLSLLPRFSHSGANKWELGSTGVCRRRSLSPSHYACVFVSLCSFCHAAFYVAWLSVEKIEKVPEEQEEVICASNEKWGENSDICTITVFYYTILWLLTAAGAFFKLKEKTKQLWQLYCVCVLGLWGERQKSLFSCGKKPEESCIQFSSFVNDAVFVLST